MQYRTERRISLSDCRRRVPPPGNRDRSRGRWSLIACERRNRKERTSQEKKSLSLAKDRRHVYDEAPPGPRKSIPLRKKLRHHVNRHHQESKWPSEPAPFEAEAADEIESSRHDKVPPV